jgi:2-polyprenyl-3-methyl-5-hydroxy-6-metoxy-1,4-benzoquinol methylase
MTRPSLYQDKPVEYFDLVREDVLALVPAGTRRLLDIGCGTGATARAAKERGAIAEVWGIESAGDAADLAARRLDRVLGGDLEALDVPIPAGYFDCIVCADVLEHLRDPWTSLGRIRELLAADGTLVISLPNVRHLRPLFKIVFDRFEYEESGILDKSHLRFFTPHTMRQLLEQAGFEITRRAQNRSRSPLYDTVVALSLGLLAPFTVYQYLFAARRKS